MCRSLGTPRDAVNQSKPAFLYILSVSLFGTVDLSVTLRLPHGHTAAQVTTHMKHTCIHSARCSSAHSLHCSAICSDFVEEKAAVLWEAPHGDVSRPSVSELIMMYASLRQIAVMYRSCLQTCLRLPSMPSRWFKDLWRSLQRLCCVSHHFSREDPTACTQCP